MVAAVSFVGRSDTTIPLFFLEPTIILPRALGVPCRPPSTRACTGKHSQLESKCSRLAVEVQASNTLDSYVSAARNVTRAAAAVAIMLAYPRTRPRRTKRQVPPIGEHPLGRQHHAPTLLRGCPPGESDTTVGKPLDVLFRVHRPTRGTGRRILLWLGVESQAGGVRGGEALPPPQPQRR